MDAQNVALSAAALGSALPIVLLPPPPPESPNASDDHDHDLDHDPEMKLPKKRSESWSHEEIRALIALRKDLSHFFNISKSNKHLWDQISSKMRDQGYERTPTMCTDKWRNLIKEYKRAKNRQDPSKVRFRKELEEIIGHSAKQTPFRSAPASAPASASASALPTAGFPAVAPLVQKEVGGSPANAERGGVGQEGQPAVSGVSHDANLSNCMSSWNWRDGSPNNTGERGGIPAGRVITVRFGGMSRRIGIDGSAEAIKEAIRCAFSLRSKRGFWLEDEDGIVRCFDRDLPLGSYSLNLDEGVTVKICVYNGDEVTGMTEDRTFFSEDDFHQFLAKRGWSSLRRRDVGSFRDIECIAHLQSMAVYERGGTHKHSGI